MRKVVFPPIEAATEDGLVAVGGDLELDTLLEAYQQGIFPWPISVEFPLAWFSPDPRGVLDFSELHLPRSFLKFLKKHSFQVTFNQAFDKVIRQCARAYRKNQPSTWITPDIIIGYEKLFKAGFAYSVEVWNEGQLVGGIYGVCMGQFVSGESMFSIETGASKYALITLIEQLKSRGLEWLDIQMLTSVTESFGGKYIGREDFLERIEGNDFSQQGHKLFQK